MADQTIEESEAAIKSIQYVEKTQDNIQEGKPEGVQLKKEIGLFSAVNLILGVMIGSGIFISPSSALKYSGSVGLCLIIWIVSGVISFLGALSFAELGTVILKSGAEYTYFLETFGKLHKFWGPLPAFTCAWVYVMILRPAETAIVIMTFSEYAIQPFGVLFDFNSMDEISKYQTKKMIAILALGVITYINLTSVKLFLKIQNIFSAFKVIVCMIIIIGGVYQLIIGNTENLSEGFTGSNWDAGSLSLALYSGLWAFDGWNSVTVVTEEIINPAVNIPLSIAIAVPLITALYVFMNAAYMTVLSRAEMMAVPAVAVAFGEKILGPVSFVIPLGVALATFSCAMSVQFGVTRVCYVAAREGHMLELFSFVHMKRLTPAPAVAFQGLLSLLFILSGDIAPLIEFASLLLWIFYGMAMVCLIVLRRTQAKTPRPYKVPIVVPYFVLFMSIFLSIVPIASDPSLKYFFALGFILSGVVVYAAFVYNKRSSVVVRKVTIIFQILFESIPTDSHKD